MIEELQTPWREWRGQWSRLSDKDRRLSAIRAAGVACWIAIPLFLWVRPQNGLDPPVEWPGTRVIWTIVVALLPAAIVAMGFYTWRQVCPLMFFSRMSEWIGWPDKRTTPAPRRRRRYVSPWLAHNYPIVTWSFLFVMLALRILLINSDPIALAITFVSLSVAAMVSGFIYTGKAWCNFICPVGTIEKLYTDGDRPQFRRNSQCPGCTGCKTHLTHGLCPDINQENDYWQELYGFPRAFAYYAFPGLVLGFYTWYFLHFPDYWNERGGPVLAGQELRGHDGLYDWGYYLSGDWTRVTRPWKHLMDPGFGFPGSPPIPTVIAAPLTLAFFSLVSFLLFMLVERAWMEILSRRRRDQTVSRPGASGILLRAGPAREDAGQGLSQEQAMDSVRHPLFAWAGFLSFNLFYAFAGAPSLRQLPLGLHALFQFSMVVFSSWVLYTRLQRSRVKLWRFDQARKWLGHWPWNDEPPPEDLNDVYTTYTLRTKFSDDRFHAYKDAVRSMLAENRVTTAELDMLDQMAADLGINQIEQQKIMRAIAREHPELLATDGDAVGDSLRLTAYRGEIERMLFEHQGTGVPGGLLQDLQARYRVQPTEHDQVLHALLNPDGTRVQRLNQEVEGIQVLRRQIAVLSAYQGPAIHFLIHELSILLKEDQEHILQFTSLYGLAGGRDPISADLVMAESGACKDAMAWIRDDLPGGLGDRIVDAVCGQDTVPGTGDGVDELASILRFLSEQPEPYIRAAAVHAMQTVLSGPGIRETLTRALADPEPLIREAAVSALGIALSPGLSSLERMFALRGAPLFAHVATLHLQDIASGAEEIVFEPGESLCTEGDLSDQVYILIDGRTEAVQERNGETVRLGFNEPGECVGEMAILEPGPRTATVRPLPGPVRVLSVRGEEFRSLLSRDSNTALGVIRLMIRRQRQKN